MIIISISYLIEFHATFILEMEIIRMNREQSIISSEIILIVTLSFFALFYFKEGESLSDG